ncbi:hypothetical protein L873DRAFT_405672 [Choiromyces venosus 120613-1]|uniref:Uncharacterized protein n=1 Tax=Choiromyces venosus 120613-1 TaxID=1336337 RepID=A0A3N4JW93_9PEZI|nr:hypothetical protein L873DRAFT_405672 [Choiromyces venosus 120613-1]
MVTHCSSNRSIRCLFTAERTGCEIFIVLWPNTLAQLVKRIYTRVCGNVQRSPQPCFSTTEPNGNFVKGISHE